MLKRIYANDARIGSFVQVEPTTGRAPFEGQVIACVQADEDAPKQWVVLPEDPEGHVFFATVEELT